MTGLLRSDHMITFARRHGTLRLLALSLLAYAEAEDQRGLYLVEEPENGVGPPVCRK